MLTLAVLPLSAQESQHVQRNSEAINGKSGAVNRESGELSKGNASKSLQHEQHVVTPTNQLKLLAPQQAAYMNTKTLSDAIAILQEELEAQGMLEYATLCKEARFKRAIEMTFSEQEDSTRRNLIQMAIRREVKYYSVLDSSSGNKFLQKWSNDKIAEALGEPAREYREENSHYQDIIKPLYQDILEGGWPARSFFLFTFDDNHSTFYVDLQLDTRGGKDFNMIGYHPTLGWKPYAVPVLRVSHGPSRHRSENYHPSAWTSEQFLAKNH